MSSTRGSRTLSDILPDLCRVCRKIPEWYSNMPGQGPISSYMTGYSDVSLLIPQALVVETAARGHLKCLRAALSASPGEYECVHGVKRLEPGDRPLIHFQNGLLYGHSALMAAAWNGHPRCVKLLIKENFTMCVHPDESEVITAPICMAVRGFNKECFELLFMAHRKQNSMFGAFENAIIKGFDDCVRELIFWGADVKQVDEDGRTLLMCRNPSDNAYITKALVEGRNTLQHVTDFCQMRIKNLSINQAGANPNIELDKDGNALEGTALTTHIDEDAYKCVCVLLKAEADVNATNDGRAPLMHAVTGFVKNKLKLVVALLLKGAKINILSEYSGVNSFRHILGNSEENPLTKSLVNPLTHSLMQGNPEVDREMQRILFAAGEKIDVQAVEAKGKKSFETSKAQV